MDFILAVENHALIRLGGQANRASRTYQKLLEGPDPEQTTYWICAYANNQWKLSEDVSSDPLQTSFFRAMSQCRGLLLVLDEHAMPFSRVWCCFEMAMVIQQLRDQLPLDIATVLSGEPQLITRGLTDWESVKEAQRAGEGTTLKSARETKFPLQLIERGFGIDVTTANASVQSDKQRILNTINGLTENLDTVQPDLGHLECARVNRALRGVFSEAAVGGAAKRGRLDLAVQVLAEDDSSRSELRLSLQNCNGVTDTDWLVDVLSNKPAVTKLAINFAGCNELSDLSGLCRAVRRLHSLEQLSLVLWDVWELGEEGTRQLEQLQSELCLNKFEVLYDPDEFYDQDGLSDDSYFGEPDPSFYDSNSDMEA